MLFLAPGTSLRWGEGLPERREEGTIMNSELSFCVVVPLYNEELGVERCVKARRTPL